MATCVISEASIVTGILTWQKYKYTEGIESTPYEFWLNEQLEILKLDTQNLNVLAHVQNVVKYFNSISQGLHGVNIFLMPFLILWFFL